MTSKYKDQPAFPVTSDNFANPQSTGMTIREYAAIKLKVPDSGTAWLDEMIRTAQRNELEAKVIQGVFGNPECCPMQQVQFDNIAEDAARMAGTLLKARDA